MTDITYTVADVSSRPPAVCVKFVRSDGDAVKLRMTEKIWERWSLTRGDVVTDEAMEHIRSDSEKCEATTKALSYLSYSSYSVKGLEMKLRRAGFSSEASRVAAEAAEKKGLIDEIEQACRIARREAESKRRGPSRIKQDLLAHGYGSGAVETAVESVEEAVYTIALEEELSRRCPDGVPVEEAGRRKLISALIRRGFSLSSVIKAVEKIEN